MQTKTKRETKRNFFFDCLKQQKRTLQETKKKKQKQRNDRDYNAQKDDKRKKTQSILTCYICSIILQFILFCQHLKIFISFFFVVFVCFVKKITHTQRKIGHTGMQTEKAREL